MAQAAVAADVDQSLDVGRDLAPQIALDLQRLHDLADTLLFLRRQIFDPRVGVDFGLREDLLRRRDADAKDVRETNRRRSRPAT